MGARARRLPTVQIRMADTFDSSPTRKRGDRIAMPKGYADVDLDEIRGKIAGSIERAKAEDPKELRNRIRALEAELKKRPTDTKIETVTETVMVQVPAIAPETLAKLEDLLELLSSTTRHVGAAASEISTAIATVTNSRPPAVEPVQNGDFAISASQQRILDALAMLEGIGMPPADKTQLALFAGMKPTSGGYMNNLGALRNQAGMIEYPAAGIVALTDTGRTHADATAAPSRPDEMHDLLRGLVTSAQWAIVSTLISRYPEPLDREELAEVVGVPVTSGGFKNNLGRMRSLGIIDYPEPGLVVALPVLFLEAA